MPLSWQLRALGGFLREADPNPITIRLVAGDERVELASVALGDSSDSLAAADTQSRAVAVDGDPGLEDLAIEVEYDGLTQTARVATGEIDAGAAQPLYEDDRNLATGCTGVEDRCLLRAVDRASPVRPYSGGFTASYVTLYPYDAQLGWADEGTLWAGVRLQLFGADAVVNAAGGYWSASREGAPTVTLDGAKPVRREGLRAARDDTSGRLVFRVDADGDPAELTLRQVVSPQGPGAPPDLPLRARLDLKPVG